MLLLGVPPTFVAGLSVPTLAVALPAPPAVQRASATNVARSPAASAAVTATSGGAYVLLTA